MNQIAQKPKTGILLVNLGSPNSPQTKDVRIYLRQFLMDSRIIDIPFLSRWLLVNLIIAPFRSPNSARLYQELWLKEGSPLKIYGHKNRSALQKKLGKQFVVQIAMRYQNPSLESVLGQIQMQNVKKLIVIPLFPQYCSATVGSIHEKVFQIVKNWRTMPAMSIINNFYQHQLFSQIYFQNSFKYINEIKYDHYLFSYHGIPQSQAKQAHRGKSCQSQNCDKTITSTNFHCYKAQCYQTTLLLSKKLNLESGNFTTCFQSRLGKAEWLRPYTSDILKQLVQKGIKKVLVFAPAFVADCLETTIEVAKQYREEFLALGGERWDLVESCNNSDIWIQLLKDLVLKNC